MLPLSVEQIRGSFVNCSKGEAKKLTMPTGVAELPWDDLDFLGWRDPKAPARAYLVRPKDDRTIGLTLRAAPPATSRLRSNLCGLCFTFQDAMSITLFTAPRAGKAGRDGNTLGLYACADLACSRYVRGTLSPTIAQPAETLTVAERIDRLRNAIDAFVDRIVEE